MKKNKIDCNIIQNEFMKMNAIDFFFAIVILLNGMTLNRTVFAQEHCLSVKITIKATKENQWPSHLKRNARKKKFFAY